MFQALYQHSRLWVVPVILVTLAAAACSDDAGTAESSPDETTTTAVETTTTTTEAPVDIAEAWIAAYGDGDPVTYEGLMSPDAFFKQRMDSGPFFSAGWAVSEARESMLFFAGGGSIDATCTAEVALVSCITRMPSALGDQDNPLEVELEFVIGDGKIVEYTYDRINASRVDFTRVAAYERRLQETHPEDHTALFFLTTMLLNDKVQVEKHRDLVAEWAASG
jgi:hypothetical protein